MVIAQWLYTHEPARLFAFRAHTRARVPIEEEAATQRSDIPVPRRVVRNYVFRQTGACFLASNLSPFLLWPCVPLPAPCSPATNLKQPP